MIYSNFNFYIIGGFLILTLIVGIWGGRETKDIGDYALANKTYGIGIVTLTFLATYFDAFNILRSQEQILKKGVIASFQPLATSILFLALGYWIAPKVRRFTKCLTIGDVMTEFYGELGGLISSVISSIYVVGMIGLQMVAFGKISESFLGWDFRLVVIVGGAILVLSSALGGVRSVTMTDILQFVVFIIILPSISITALRNAGGLKEILAFLPADKIEVFGHPEASNYTFSYLSWLLPYYIASPPIFQRILMVSKKSKSSNMLYLSSVFILCAGALVLFICLAVLKLNPDINIEPGAAFIYIIKTYFSPIMQSVSLVAILAIMMSTIDSFLNSGSVLISNNVIKPLFRGYEFISDELKLVRITTFILGIISILIATRGDNLISIYIWSVSLSLPMIAVPLLAGIMGLKTDYKSFIISVILTFVVVVITMLKWTSQESYRAFFVFFVNLIIYFTVHIVQNRGISIIKTRSYKN